MADEPEPPRSALFPLLLLALLAVSCARFAWDHGAAMKDALLFVLRALG